MRDQGDIDVAQLGKGVTGTPNLDKADVPPWFIFHGANGVFMNGLVVHHQHNDTFTSAHSPHDIVRTGLICEDSSRPLCV